MGRRPRTGDERRQISVRPKVTTIGLFADRAKAKGLPPATYISDYLDRAADAILYPEPKTR